MVTSAVASEAGPVIGPAVQSLALHRHASEGRRKMLKGDVWRSGTLAPDYPISLTLLQDIGYGIVGSREPELLISTGCDSDCVPPSSSRQGTRSYT